MKRSRDEERERQRLRLFFAYELARSEKQRELEADGYVRATFSKQQRAYLRFLAAELWTKVRRYLAPAARDPRIRIDGRLPRRWFESGRELWLPEWFELTVDAMGHVRMPKSLRVRGMWKRDDGVTVNAIARAVLRIVFRSPELQGAICGAHRLGSGPAVWAIFEPLDVFLKQRPRGAAA